MSLIILLSTNQSIKNNSFPKVRNEIHLNFKFSDTVFRLPDQPKTSKPTSTINLSTAAELSSMASSNGKYYIY